MLLNETVPQWVIDITVDVSTSPDFTSTSMETFITDVLKKSLTFFHTYLLLIFCFRKICPSSTKSHSTSSHTLPPAPKR